MQTLTPYTSRPTGELPDGTPLRVRPLRPEDRCTLAERFRRLSAESRYSRFLTLFSALSEPLLDTLVDGVDGDVHVALVLLACVDGEEVEVAIGRYFRDRSAPHRAEVAFTVDDPWQGRGCGRALVHLLAEHARSAGVTTFTATVLSENTASLRLLRSLGPTRTRYDGSSLEAQVDLCAPPPGSSE